MTDGPSIDPSGRFVEQFVSLTDDDIRRLAMWTRTLKGDQPEAGRDWRAAASREFNSVGRHPAEQAYDDALESASVLLATDARSVLSLDDLLDRLGEAAAKRQLTRAFAWRGRRRSLLANRFGLVAAIGCMAFLAAAIGVGLGGRDDLMAVMAVSAFGLAAVAMIPYVAWPMSPPTEPEAQGALAAAILATALRERLSARDFERLMDPWRRAIEADPRVDPPRRWRTAVFAGRLGIAGMTVGGMAFLAAGFLQILVRR